MDSDFFSDSYYDEFANEILFVGDILQLFRFELIFITAEIQAAKKSLVPAFDQLLRHRT